MSFKLNNSAECLGYLCLFIAMNDGKLHKKEAKRTIQSMAKMLAELELDSNNDGDVNIDDLITSYKYLWTQMPDNFKDASRHFIGICVNYFESWSVHNKKMIVDMLADIARADNVIQDTEKGNVNLVAKMFGIPEPF